MKFVAVTAALAIGLIAGVSAANAAPAFANNGADVRLGPTFDSPTTGFMPKGATMDANCNPTGWCEVVGTGRNNTFAGWVEAGNVTFSDGGMQPAPQPRPPAPGPNTGGNNSPGFSLDFNFGNPGPAPRPQPLPQPVYEEAGACFYTGRNFQGASFCVDEGESYTRLRDWNDVIRSVEVFGGAVVDLCTDPNFYGNCVTVENNVSRLPSGIDRRVSSLEVYY